MKHRLTFKDDKSDKFWNIEVDETSFTVTYGKTGTIGQTQTKSFDDEEKCLKEAEKLLSEKLKKGYVEDAILANTKSATVKKNPEPSNEYLKEWEELANSKSLHRDLTRHFIYLADTPGFEPVVAAMMQKAQKAEIREDLLVIHFEEGRVITASPPVSSNPYVKWPASFQKLIQQHGRIVFGKYGDIQLGDHGIFDFDMFDDGDDVFELFKGKGANARSPLFSNAPNKTSWLYHPKLKNSQGEPAIFPCTHELEDEIDPVYSNVGSLFLERVADKMYLTISIPETAPTNSTSQENASWWSYVDYAAFEDESYYQKSDNGPLKEPFPDDVLSKLENLKVADIPDLQILPLDKLSNLQELTIYNYEKVKLTNLNGIEKLTHLTELRATRNKIEDITPMGTLKELKTLDLQYNKIVNIAPLAHCRKLEYIYLTKNKIKDISTVFGLESLVRIWIEDNPVSEKTLEELQNKKPDLQINTQ
ncbi:WGR domain-containing protein [Leptospira santarosai]|uniref:Leucine rich repeat protein n=1 Tax=Leptospira santarosai str. ZUN179 TaxID=1049985 RepID=M6UF58_9LEPT|nr:WGR domain-containing protein [Leptospira santarosai]EMO43727.1 leucine rich repeat protein [Leptospira santarosai str. ZUN179]